MTFPQPISWLGMQKLNITQRKDTFTNQKKCTTTQNKLKNLKPGLVASYDIWPGNGEGLFWFRCFMNLSLINFTYLDTYSRYSRLSNRFNNRYDNLFDNRLYRVNGALRDPHGPTGQLSAVRAAVNYLKPNSITGKLSGSNQLRNSFEPHSVMEFGREPASSC